MRNHHNYSILTTTFLFFDVLCRVQPHGWESVLPRPALNITSPKAGKVSDLKSNSNQLEMDINWLWNWIDISFVAKSVCRSFTGQLTSVALTCSSHHYSDGRTFSKWLAEKKIQSSIFSGSIRRTSMNMRCTQIPSTRENMRGTKAKL